MTSTGKKRLCLISERQRYIDRLIESDQIHATLVHEETPFGCIVYYVFEYKNVEVIYIINKGETLIDDVNAPLAITSLCEKHNIIDSIYIAKVGGINPLLKVNDILLPDDIINASSHTKLSYHKQLNPLTTLHYLIDDPFSDHLREICFRAIRNNQKETSDYDRHIFKSGVCVSTTGPTFETKSEISLFRGVQADIVAHCFVPLVYYLREIEVQLGVVGIVSNFCTGYRELQDLDFIANDDKFISYYGKLVLSIVEMYGETEPVRVDFSKYWLQYPKV